MRLRGRFGCLLMALLMVLLVVMLSACASTSSSKKSQGLKGAYVPKGKQSWQQIAQQHQVSLEALRRFNPRSQEAVPLAGRKLLIPAKNSDARAQGPYYYYIQAGDTFSSLAQHFHLSVISLLEANPKLAPTKLRLGQRVLIPVQNRQQNTFQWPVTQPQVKINFSWQRWGMHKGLALATKTREEVFPLAPGKVVFAGQVRGFGRLVIVQHAHKLQSIYAYCHVLFVEQDARLSGRHPVCAAGNQGRLGTAGIYLELRKNGVPVPPEDYLPALSW